MLKKVLVENPHGNDLEFEGELLVDERNHEAGFVKVWRTRGGRYVLKQTRSHRPGVVDISRAEKFDTVEGLSEILGHSSGAKAIARKLGLSRTERIE